MTDYAGLMKLCQRGFPLTKAGAEHANNALAACYGAIGALIAENETHRAELAWSESDSREQSAELTKLRAELAGLRTGFDAQNQVIAGLKKDAERYRWLRDGAGYCDTRDIPGMAPTRMDEFIDAAMGKGGNDGA